jgi:hypothetical protein
MLSFDEQILIIKRQKITIQIVISPSSRRLHSQISNRGTLLAISVSCEL